MRPLVLMCTMLMVAVGSPMASAVAEESASPAAGCFSGTFEDPADDADLDVTSMSLLHSCETNLLRFDVHTRDNWSAPDLFSAVIGFDTDVDDATGCDPDDGGLDFGSDYALISFRTNSAGERSTSLFETPSCDESTWIDRGPAYYEKLDGNSMRLEVNRSRIGNPVDLRTGAYVEDLFEDFLTGDIAPDAGAVVRLDGNVRTCTRCYYFTDELRGGVAANEFSFGRSDDIVFSGDWDGDGDDTLGVRRGREYFLMTNLRGGIAETQFTYGRTGDEVFIGDWNGDGVDTLGVRRGNVFYLNNRQRGGNADEVFGYGRAGDIVHVGDWDGDGADTLMVQRGRTFYQTNQLRGGAAETTFVYGRVGDEVFVGDWDANGTDTLGVRRSNKFFLTNRQQSGNASITFSFGRRSDRILIGDWDGDGVDTIGIRR